MFAPDISRLGYDDTGRVWSIICPQQGVCEPSIGCLNVEVTVTGQRGWADETNREVAADMTVEGTIWFSPSAHQNWFVKEAWKLVKESSLPFPSDKANAIKVTTHKSGSPRTTHTSSSDRRKYAIRVLTLPSTQKHGQLEMWKCRSAQSKRQIMTPSIPLIKKSWIYSTWLLATCYSLTMCCLGTSGSRHPSS